jgi:hypothetical protein
MTVLQVQLAFCTLVSKVGENGASERLCGSVVLETEAKPGQAGWSNMHVHATCNAQLLLHPPDAQSVCCMY